MQITAFYNFWYRVSLFLLCMSACTTQLAWGAKAKLEEAPVASHYWSETYYDSQKGNTDTTHKIKKTILTPEGIQEVSRIGFIYAQNDRVRVISMGVTQPDGTRIKLKKSQMDTRLLARSSNGFTMDKQLSFLLPELKVGSVVELIFEHFHSGRSDPGKPGVSFVFPLQNERVESCVAEYTSDQPWVFKKVGTEAFDIQLSEDNKKLTIQQKTPQYYYFTNEIAGCSYVRQLPRVVMHTTEAMQVNLDREIRAWNENLKAPLPQSMRAVVEQLKDKAPEDKVIGLLRYLRDNYRYLGDWRPSRRGWLPFSLKEIAQRGYGDCKDLSMALVAMLRASGIEAEPAIVNRGIYASPILLSSVVHANHAIVRAKIGNKIWWLDPTNPVFLPNYIMPDIHDRWAVVFTQDNQVRQDQIPREVSDLPELETEEIDRYDQRGNLQVEVKSTLSRNQAFLRIARDYYQGIEKENLQLCGGDTKNCTTKRQKIDFVVPDAYTLELSSYKKEIAKSMLQGDGNLWVAYNLLGNFAVNLRHYIDNQGVCDFFLGSYETKRHRVVLKDCYLTQPVKSYHIQSPWFDYELKWSNVKEDKSCVIEFRRVRKVDWLDHKTIMSEEFKVFLEEVEAMAKVLSQPVKVTRISDLKP